ncbi:MAG: hypothetical protein ABL970_08720 [Nitrospira sp.]
MGNVGIQDLTPFSVLAAIFFVSVAVGTCLAANNLSSPNREVLLFQEFGQIFILSPDGGEPQEIPYDRNHGSAKGLAAKPTLFIHLVDDQRQFILQEVAFSGEVLAQYQAPVATEVAVSPDGTQVLYESFLEGNSLWIQTLLSGAKLEVWGKEPSSPHYRDLTWSSGSDLIAFTKDVPQQVENGWFRHNFQTYYMRVADKQPVLLSQNLYARNPVFSPDSRHIAYWEKKDSAPEGEWDLYVQEIASIQNSQSRVKVIGRAKIHVGPISWSPDGQWLLWGENIERGRLLGRKPFFDFYKVRVDGSDLHEIPVERPLWRRVWREIWPPSEKNGSPQDIQWWAIPASVPKN